MLPITKDEIQRWRVELDNSQDFRQKHFGSAEGTVRWGVGENIEYLERGDIAIGTRDVGIDERPFHSTLNMIHTLTKNIVPSLYFRNPKILAFPKRVEDEKASPVAAALLNYYFDELGIKETNQQIILDAYVLGMGISKIGYATQFGMDIPDEGEEKRKAKSKLRLLQEAIGLKKPKEEEKPQNVELEENITAENPYVTWVSPFDFLIDPRATAISNAQWVAHRIRKTLDEVKKNKNFKNTSKLKGQEPEEEFIKDVPSTELDKFKTIDLFEIHYKTPKGINILILAKEGDRSEFLYHDKSIYKMDGFQFEILYFNKHGHKLYAKSDVDIVKPLQDRLTLTFDSILDQVDSFVSKILVDDTNLTAAGRLALRDGNLGAIVDCNKNPNEVVKELSLVQLKGDMLNLVNQIVDIMTLESGLTRAQLTGLTTAETATEAQIGQAGSNIRLFARADAVQDFSNRQSRKLWQVIRQFVDLDEIQLITGEQATDEQGVPRFTWLKDADSDAIAKAELRFQIEVGSTQKPDVAVVRKEFENFINILARTDVIALLQQQGTKVDLGELIRLHLKQFPEMIKDIGRIIKPIQTGAQGALSQEQVQAQLGVAPAGDTTLGQVGAISNQQTPSPTSMQEQIGGEAGQI